MSPNIGPSFKGILLCDRFLTCIASSHTHARAFTRACDSHDWELNMADVDPRGAKEGTHGVMVDAIRHHRSVWWGHSEGLSLVIELCKFTAITSCHSYRCS